MMYKKPSLYKPYNNHSLTIWHGYKLINERGRFNLTTGYTGIETYKKYPRGEYTHSSIYIGKVVNKEFPDQTGMMHLDFKIDKELYKYKKDFLNKEVYLEESHNWSKIKIYRAYLKDFSKMDYFSEKELEIKSIFIK